MDLGRTEPVMNAPDLLVIPRGGRALPPIVLAAAILVAGCAPKTLAPKGPLPARHDLHGEVVGVNAARGTLLVHHDEIPGYMPSMTMEFTAPGADLSSFREGQRIGAQMLESAPGEFQLQGLRVLDPQKDRDLAAAALALRQDTHTRGNHAYREIGETAPTFALYNQDGAVVQFDHFRGQRVVLNFIFTRCPVATMCPAATARMAALQCLARERRVPDFQLVSITLDPAYDTPAVLKAYATARGIDPSNFSFLTGPESAIRDLLEQFGVLAEPSENIWKHTLATVLIDRDGKIIHRIDGSAWEPDDILKRL